MQSSGKQSGNILFLILLAVVLFAALAYAVTSSMRGGGKDAGSENLQMQISDIMQFFGEVEAGLMRMQLTGNIKPEDIDMDYPFLRDNGTPVAYGTNSRCTNDRCRLFRSDGGGVTPRTFENYGCKSNCAWNSSWEKRGYYTFLSMQWPGAGTDAVDVVMRIGGLHSALCPLMNKRHDVTVTPTFTGTYTTAFPVSNWAASDYAMVPHPSFAGKSVISSGNANYCQIYYLMIAR